MTDEYVECNTCGCMMEYIEKEGVYACFNQECTRCYEFD
jgi:hypothetical protein